MHFLGFYTALFAHAKMLKDGFENLGCCYLAAGDFAKVVETSTQVFTQQVAAEAGSQAIKNTG